MEELERQIDYHKSLSSSNNDVSTDDSSLPIKTIHMPEIDAASLKNSFVMILDELSPFSN
jgi:hypothetical protein